jgi:hypothetical protein
METTAEVTNTSNSVSETFQKHLPTFSWLILELVRKNDYEIVLLSLFCSYVQLFRLFPFCFEFE